jgi:precorrin-8X/cobalt-precorrin-8 methylmutase
MVRSGIIKRGLPAGIEIICTLNDTRTRDIGMARRTTRSAAAVELWKPHLAASVVVIGNAPTALFALLELIDCGGPPPSAIIATPVGFVGAAESKAELVSDPRGIPFATLLGRRGGSALAAAALNAIIAGRAA